MLNVNNFILFYDKQVFYNKGNFQKKFILLKKNYTKLQPSFMGNPFKNSVIVSLFLPAN